MGLKIMSSIKAMVLIDKKYDFNWREEIMCGIIAMFYIDKYHNYDLNWEVIMTSTVIEFHNFSYRATESTMQRFWEQVFLSNATGASIGQWSTGESSNCHKIVIFSFFFFFYYRRLASWKKDCPEFYYPSFLFITVNYRMQKSLFFHAEQQTQPCKEPT